MKHEDNKDGLPHSNSHLADILAERLKGIEGKGHIGGQPIDHAIDVPLKAESAEDNSPGDDIDAAIEGSEGKHEVMPKRKPKSLHEHAKAYHDSKSKK